MRIFVLLAALALCSGGVRLQADDARFDVVSVKPNKSGNQGPRTLTFVPGALRVINLPLYTILWMAHGVQANQIVDVPSWAESESFDITGKFPDGAGPPIETFRPMLVNVLADRFALKTHREMRELAVYRLVRVRQGQLGSKLTAAAEGCAARTPTAPLGRGRAGLNCGATARLGGFSVHGMPITTLTRLLGPAVGRVVVDETGLTGNWDLELDYSPEQIQGSAFPGVGGPAPPSPGEGPSLFTALQEQAGLKLESGRAPVEVIVIDHIDRPTDD